MLQLYKWGSRGPGSSLCARGRGPVPTQGLACPFRVSAGKAESSLCSLQWILREVYFAVENENAVIGLGMMSLLDGHAPMLMAVFLNLCPRSYDTFWIKGLIWPIQNRDFIVGGTKEFPVMVHVCMCMNWKHFQVHSAMPSWVGLPSTVEMACQEITEIIWKFWYVVTYVHSWGKSSLMRNSEGYPHEKVKMQ